MFYVSFEIETPLDIDLIDGKWKCLSVRDMYIRKKVTATKDGTWFYKVYDDISCGAEFVTLPMELGKDLTNSNVDDIATLVYYIMRELKDRYSITDKLILDKLGVISTHITFTTSKYRNKPMPRYYVNNAIKNMINFYFPILYETAMCALFPLTRSTYFRRYYQYEDGYVDSKGDYPAVFVPSYKYNDLPPYHKIEFRVPDTLLLSSKKEIAYLLDMYIKLMTQYIDIDKITQNTHIQYNKMLERNMANKGDIYTFGSKYLWDDDEDIIIREYIKDFKERFDLG